MNQQKIFILLLICFITLSVSFFYFKDAWREPDSLRFYNRSCLGASEFVTPIISEIVFKFIPCSMFAWKTAHLLLILATISSLYFFSKKILKSQTMFWISFISYFLLNFILGIEDDQLAFPIIIGLTTILLDNTTWKKRIGYTIGILFLTFFIWQGSYIPMLIFLAWTIEPILGITLSIGAMIFQYIMIGGTDAFGNSHIGNELVSGTGYIVNDLIILLFWFAKDKKQKIKANRNTFLLFTGFNVLSLFIPKLAYYSVIPNLMMAKLLFDDNQKEWLILAGLLILCLAPAMLLWNSYPNPQTWKVIEEAVIIQKDSNIPFYNEWFVGSWLYYKGGNPTQEGGYAGEQPDPKYGVIEYYWLGLSKKNCVTIDSSDRLKLQHCFTLYG